MVSVRRDPGATAQDSPATPQPEARFMLMRRKVYALSALAAAVILAGLLSARLGEAAKVSANAAGALPQATAIVCWHTQFSDYQCPDSSRRLLVDATEIASVSVSITTKDGKKYSQTTKDPVDALFFTKKAVEIFLLVHYDVLPDRKKSRELRKFLNIP